MHSKDKEGNTVMSAQPRDLFTEENFRKFERSWDDGRIPTAFFRGKLHLMKCFISTLNERRDRFHTLLSCIHLNHQIHKVRQLEVGQQYITTNV